MSSCDLPEDFLYDQVPQEGPDGVSAAELSQQQLQSWLKRFKDAVQDCTDALDAAKVDVFAYSTTPVKTGETWIDGKPIYRKVVDVGAMPNSTQKQVAHNITDLDWCVALWGMCEDPTQPGAFRIIGGVDVGAVGQGLELKLDDSPTPWAIEIETGVNRSNYSQGYVVIEYTSHNDD